MRSVGSELERSGNLQGPKWSIAQYVNVPQVGERKSRRRVWAQAPSESPPLTVSFLFKADDTSQRWLCVRAARESTLDSGVPTPPRWFPRPRDRARSTSGRVAGKSRARLSKGCGRAVPPRTRTRDAGTRNHGAEPPPPQVSQPGGGQTLKCLKASLIWSQVGRGI